MQDCVQIKIMNLNWVTRVNTILLAKNNIFNNFYLISRILIILLSQINHSNKLESMPSFYSSKKPTLMFSTAYWSSWLKLISSASKSCSLLQIDSAIKFSLIFSSPILFFCSESISVFPKCYKFKIASLFFRSFLEHFFLDPAILFNLKFIKSFSTFFIDSKILILKSQKC